MALRSSPGSLLRKWQVLRWRGTAEALWLGGDLCLYVVSRLVITRNALPYGVKYILLGLLDDFRQL